MVGQGKHFLGPVHPFYPPCDGSDLHPEYGGGLFQLFGDDLALALVSLGASVVVAVLMARNFFPGKWGRLSLSLILAGAAGNLIDRALLGFVTDMLQTTFMEFAVFNVADICVVAGGFLMAGYVLLRWDKDREAQDDPA